MKAKDNALKKKAETETKLDNYHHNDTFSNIMFLKSTPNQSVKSLENAEYKFISKLGRKPSLRDKKESPKIESIISDIKDNIEEIKTQEQSLKVEKPKANGLVNQETKMRIPEIKLNDKLQIELISNLDSEPSESAKLKDKLSVQNKSNEYKVIKLDQKDLKDLKEIELSKLKKSKKKRLKKKPKSFDEFEERIRREILRFDLNQSKSRFKSSTKEENSINRKSLSLPRQIFRRNYQNSYWKKNSPNSKKKLSIKKRKKRRERKN